MSKPTENIQIKRYKDREYRFLCFHSIRLKMNDSEFIRKMFEITKKWEKIRGVKLIGPTFNEIKEENFSKQKIFLLSPQWLNLILTECGYIPNKYSFENAINRINHFKQYNKISVDKDKKLFNLLLKNKKWGWTNNNKLANVKVAGI